MVDLHFQQGFFDYAFQRLWKHDRNASIASLVNDAASFVQKLDVFLDVKEDLIARAKHFEAAAKSGSPLDRSRDAFCEKLSRHRVDLLNEKRYGSFLIDEVLERHSNVDHLRWDLVGACQDVNRLLKNRLLKRRFDNEARQAILDWRSKLLDLMDQDDKEFLFGCQLLRLCAHARVGSQEHTELVDRIHKDRKRLTKVIRKAAEFVYNTVIDTWHARSAERLHKKRNNKDPRNAGSADRLHETVIHTWHARSAERLHKDPRITGMAFRIHMKRNNVDPGIAGEVLDRADVGSLLEKSVTPETPPARLANGKGVSSEAPQRNEGGGAEAECSDKQIEMNPQGDQGEAKPAKKAKRVWWNLPKDRRPEEFSMGPLPGTLAGLADFICLYAEVERTGRGLERLNMDRTIWVVRVSAHRWEVYFKPGFLYSESRAFWKKLQEIEEDELEKRAKAKSQGNGSNASSST